MNCTPSSTFLEKKGSETFLSKDSPKLNSHNQFWAFPSHKIHDLSLCKYQKDTFSDFYIFHVFFLQKEVLKRFLSNFHSRPTRTIDFWHLQYLRSNGYSCASSQLAT
ncbi:hypothetical protein O6H91_21G046400 [Diphasiastrum complanatum]|uniref:Uncharacterized protein n=2 Tax=Diphasiastrum complanatum TaxID=34168 RepID=A0ACC2AKD4_DIPCM|nr:hypothetical protein O6H91_21G046400 [Diphasiastrum complanatum]KAJ7517926.1 hypothetical protein O6H91_21G046400 [Diphasiastrum complanatum]